MTFIPPPAELDNLTAYTPDMIAYPYLIQACYAWVKWKVDSGVPPEQFQQRPEVFVTEMDLERLCNVVSNWPRAAAQRPPTLPMLIDDLRTPPGQTPVRFLDRLIMFETRINSWMVQNKIDPAYPNESKEDKQKRQNAKRQREWRQRTAQPRTGAPEESALVVALRTAAENLKQARAWGREEEKKAKVTRDIAIAQAREACGKQIQWVQEWVDKAELAVLEAQKAVDNYKSS
jgi:hypothetical protein